MRRQPTPFLWGLIGLNVLVYILWQQARGSQAGQDLMAANFLVSADGVLAGRVWTLLTSAFSHIDPSHLLFNMIALYVFGGDVARVIGTRGMLHLYLVGGLVASLGHVAFNLLADSTTPALGASGSVMAIAVLFGALFPRRTLLVQFFIPVPAALAVGGYLVMDFLGLFGHGSGIAHAAHLGGAAYGLAYYVLTVRPRLVRGER
ncbi:MAG: rhomboid family intramembrane serine protease [Deltaproteobacteria bacterium]|nr:rhomboid family intramembrane serine protease [Deltaproteobacteria bacterium]